MESQFAQETFDQVCDYIADGGSMREWCKAEENRPAPSTIVKWSELGDSQREQYVRAQQRRAEKWAEEIVEIADDAPKDDVNKARLQVDARKWIASKLLPKKYGDRQTIALEDFTAETLLEALKKESK